MDNQIQNSQTLAEAVKKAAEAEIAKIEIDKFKIQKEAEFSEARDKRMHDAFCKSLETKKSVVSQVVATQKIRYLYITIISIVVLAFLGFCVYEKQISFFTPLFHYLALAVMAFIGGYGIGRNKKNKNDTDDE